MYTSLLGFEFSTNFDKKPSYFIGGLVSRGLCLFRSLTADISPQNVKTRLSVYIYFGRQVVKEDYQSGPLND